MRSNRGLLGLMACVAACLALSACGGGGGPQLDIDDVNVRNLCNFGVQGEDEERCELAAPACGADASICWDPELAGLTGFVRGFCRQCLDDNQCDPGLTCDHGWCHAACSQDADCGTGEACTESLCRKPHFTDFSFTNTGDKTLSIDALGTRLLGAADACAFSHFEWSLPGDTVVVEAGESVQLRVFFRAAGTGFFRGRIDVVSNSESNNPLPLLLCGQSVEAECAEGLGDQCAECLSNCAAEDFDSLPLTPPTCG
ncbi:MAG TPA: hypothetical protein PK668_19165 [Myxococcota bacterium]|nr:hypothetical protein [Myxococcota bacterium]HRY95148.1 hypothetical protein [Myxococcota bacterium]HSA24592.1 hypothetical protein [Myxococcota bacterium]